MIFTSELNVKIVTSCAYIFPNLGAPENQQIGVVYLIIRPRYQWWSSVTLTYGLWTFRPPKIKQFTSGGEIAKMVRGETFNI